jgi:hypothetical protein
MHKASEKNYIDMFLLSQELFLGIVAKKPYMLIKLVKIEANIKVNFKFC